MDLGIQVLKQNKGVWLVASHGQTQCQKYSKKEKIQAGKKWLVFSSQGTERKRPSICSSSAPSLRSAGDPLTLNGFILDFFSMMEEAKDRCQNGLFMEIFMLGCWLIWKQRNGFIFNRGPPSHQSWKAGFLEEAHLQANRMSVEKKNAFLTSIV
jgi:hypothetical protein